MGDAAYERLRHDFSMEGGIDDLERRFRALVANGSKDPVPA